MKQVFLITLGLSFMLCNGETATATTFSNEIRLTTQNDYRIPESWVPKKILDRNWWPVMGFYQIPGIPSEITSKNVVSTANYAKQWMELGFPMRKEVEDKIKKLLPNEFFAPRLLPAFTDTAIISYAGAALSAQPSPLNENDYCIYLRQLPEFDMPRCQNKPILIHAHNITGGSVGSRLFAFGGKIIATEEETAAFLHWRKRHPNFLGFMCLNEWGNSSRNLHRYYLENARKSGLLSEEQYPEAKQRFDRDWPDKLSSRREYVEKRLKPYFDRGVAASFNLPSEVITLEGA